MPLQNKAVTMYAGDVVQAVKIAEKFNIRSDVNSKMRAKAVLLQAIDFLDTVRDDLNQGARIEVGSAWHGPDLFLDKDLAQQIAKEKEISDQITGTSSLTLSAKELEKLATLRKAFKLSSDKQAARLAVRTYDSLCDGLWRGNGFSVRDGSNQQRPLDTRKVEAALTFSYGR